MSDRRADFSFANAQKSSALGRLWAGHFALRRNWAVWLQAPLGLAFYRLRGKTPEILGVLTSIFAKYDTKFAAVLLRVRLFRQSEYIPKGLR